MVTQPSPSNILPMAPPPTIGPSNHHLTYMDLGGTIRELNTLGTVLVFDPGLALQCEAQGLEYTLVNPSALLWLAVGPLVLPEPPTEEGETSRDLLEEQLPLAALNGVHEGSG